MSLGELNIKIGDPVYGLIDGFGCIVEKDDTALFNIMYKVHYQTGKDEWNNIQTTQDLINQLQHAIKKQERKKKNNAKHHP